MILFIEFFAAAYFIYKAISTEKNRGLNAFAAGIISVAFIFHIAPYLAQYLGKYL